MALIEKCHFATRSAWAKVRDMNLALPSETSDRWDPQLYAACASFVHRRAADLVPVLLPQPGERILDLGCGTGELTAAIAASGAEVVGLDASAEMLVAARQAFPGLRFELGDGQALAFRGEFDAVFSNAALHWMPRAAAVAEGVARALRPGGRFVAELGGHGCVRTVRSAVGDALRRRDLDPGAWMRWYFPDVAEYVSVLAAAGFGVRLAHLFERPTSVEGAGGLRAWLRTFVRGLDEYLGAGSEEFLTEVEQACKPTLWRDDAWVIDYVRLRIVAALPSRE
jgi:trans-aconitate methyltransferase